MPLRNLPPLRSGQEDADYAAQLHHHNLNRLLSMSERALQTRIRRISNIGKMRSFVEVRYLAACGFCPVSAARQWGAAKAKIRLQFQSEVSWRIETPSRL